MVKRAVVVVGIDGIMTMKTGVGRVVGDLLDALQIIRGSRGIPSRFDLFAIGPSIAEVSGDYDPRQLEKIQRICLQNGGQLGRFHISGPASSLEAVWAVRQPQLWPRLCAECADVVSDLCRGYEETIVFVHGSPLFGLRRYLENKYKIVLVPHSLWRVFAETEDLDEQVEKERDAFQSIVETNGDFIACVSQYMRKEFMERYEIPVEKLLMLENGLILENYLNKLQGVEPRQYLTATGVNLDKDIIFSWGRCDRVKGFDVVIKACQPILEDFPGIQLVLLTPVGFSGISAFDEIQDLAKGIPSGSITLLFKFDEILPLLLISIPECKAVVFASRSEASGIVALEAKAFGHGELPVIYSDIPAFSETFKDDTAAFSFESENIRDLERTIRNQIAQKTHRITSFSSYVDNVLSCLSTIAPN